MPSRDSGIRGRVLDRSSGRGHVHRRRLAYRPVGELRSTRRMRPCKQILDSGGSEENHGFKWSILAVMTITISGTGEARACAVTPSRFSAELPDGSRMDGLLRKGLPRKAAILGSLVPFVSIRLTKSANVSTIRGKTTETMPTETISTMNAVTTDSRQKSPCKRQFGF